MIYSRAIFSPRKKIEIPQEVYQNMLQTLNVRPKKKHFKKILAYIRKFESVDKVKPVLIDQIIQVGINN